MYRKTTRKRHITRSSSPQNILRTNIPPTCRATCLVYFFTPPPPPLHLTAVTLNRISLFSVPKYVTKPTLVTALLLWSLTACRSPGNRAHLSDGRSTAAVGTRSDQRSFYFSRALQCNLRKGFELCGGKTAAAATTILQQEPRK